LQPNVLKLTFLATEYNGWPKIRICIDNDILQEYDFDQNTGTVDLELDLLDGEHTLEIERYGKTNNNINYIDGQVLADQTVELVDIFVDNVKLPEIYKLQGSFHYDNQILQSTLLWGPNGKYIWRFQTPIIKWLIDKKNSTQEAIQDIITPGKPETEKIHRMLDDFERYLKETKV